ncbi:uncharacterized protein K441DRAFT_468647, partial [Cenococcum geophilum 1.58]|uniref:uncharacterized protein n=1 Tax=Cenococcum geophilum 1.58 TaxID=794803 RepID=UPI00358E96A3
HPFFNITYIARKLLPGHPNTPAAVLLVYLTDEDDEYEVEEILEARIYRRKLQYRVKWLGYED